MLFTFSEALERLLNSRTGLSRISLTPSARQASGMMHGSHHSAMNLDPEARHSATRTSGVDIAAGSRHSSINQNSLTYNGYRRNVVPLSRYQPLLRAPPQQYDWYGQDLNLYQQMSASFYRRSNPHSKRRYSYGATYTQQRASQGGSYKPKRRTQSFREDMNYVYSPTFRRVPTIVETINRHQTITPVDDEDEDHSAEDGRSVNKKHSSAAKVIDSLIKKRQQGDSYYQPNENDVDEVFDESGNACNVSQKVEFVNDSTQRVAMTRTQNQSSTEKQLKGNRSGNASVIMYQRQNVSDIHNGDETEATSTTSESLKQRMNNLRVKVANLRQTSAPRTLAPVMHQRNYSSSTDEEELKGGKMWINDECISPRKMVRRNKNMNMNRDDDFMNDVFSRSYTTVYRQQSPDTYWKQYMSTLTQNENRNVNENSFDARNDIETFFNYSTTSKKGIVEEMLQDDSYNEFDEPDAKPFISTNEEEDETYMQNLRRRIEAEENTDTNKENLNKDVPLSEIWCTTVTVPDKEKLKHECGLDGVWRTTVTVPVDTNGEPDKNTVEENCENKAMLNKAKSSPAAVEPESIEAEAEIQSETSKLLVDMSSFQNDTFCSNDSACRKYVRSFEDDGKKLYYVSTEDLCGAGDASFAREKDNSNDVDEDQTNEMSNIILTEDHLVRAINAEENNERGMVQDNSPQSAVLTSPIIIDMTGEKYEEPSFLDSPEESSEKWSNHDQPSFLKSPDSNDEVNYDIMDFQDNDIDDIQQTKNGKITDDSYQATICASPFGKTDDFNITASSTTTSATLVATVGERTIDSWTDDTLVAESDEIDV